MSAAPTREAVHAMLSTKFRPAEELPRKRGVTSGFQVCDADADGVSVAHYHSYADAPSSEPKSARLARYADLLAEHYTVEWRVGSLRVTVKR